MRCIPLLTAVFLMLLPNSVRADLEDSFRYDLNLMFESEVFDRFEFENRLALMVEDETIPASFDLSGLEVLNESGVSYVVGQVLAFPEKAVYTAPALELSRATLQDDVATPLRFTTESEEPQASAVHWHEQSGQLLLHLHLSCPCRGYTRICNTRQVYRMSLVDSETNERLWGEESIEAVMHNDCMMTTVLGRRSAIPRELMERDPATMRVRAVCGNVVQLLPIYPALGGRGPQGERGPQGPSGESGTPGPRGQPGERGEVGPPGVQGPTGEPGPRGEPGTQGERGEPGQRGEPGTQGERGDIGPVGPIGPQGLRGERGEPGTQGERGEPGTQGERGDIGPVGPIGPQGLRGESGSQGERGEPGPRGEPGTQGERGEPGPRGEPGTQGERGELGPRGEPGTQGERGEPGPRGEPGTQGERGEPGPRGDIGPPGPRGEPGSADINIVGNDALINFTTPDYAGQTWPAERLEQLRIYLEEALANKAEVEHEHFWTDLVGNIPTCDGTDRHAICRHGGNLVADGNMYVPAPTHRGRPVHTQIVATLRLGTVPGSWTQIGTLSVPRGQVLSYFATIQLSQGEQIPASAASGVQVRLNGQSIEARYESPTLGNQPVYIELRHL